MRSWEDESLLRRPPQEDSLSRRAGYAQSPSGPPVRREPFLGQALLEDRPSGRPPRAQEESRAAPQGERKRPGAPSGGREGAPGRHRLSKTPLFGTHNRQEP